MADTDIWLKLLFTSMVLMPVFGTIGAVCKNEKGPNSLAVISLLLCLLCFISTIVSFIGFIRSA